MHKSAMKYNKTLSKWCKNKHGASKIIDTLETYHMVDKFYCQDYVSYAHVLSALISALSALHR
jgi:hypothetical protein